MGFSETLTRGAQLKDCHGRVGSKWSFESTGDDKG